MQEYITATHKSAEGYTGGRSTELVPQECLQVPRDKQKQKERPMSKRATAQINIIETMSPTGCVMHTQLKANHSRLMTHASMSIKYKVAKSQ